MKFFRVRSKGVNSRIGICENLVLDLGERAVDFILGSIFRQIYYAAQPLCVLGKYLPQLFFAVLLADPALNVRDKAWACIGEVVEYFMVGDLVCTHAGMVRLQDDPILIPYAAHSPDGPVARLDRNSAKYHCYRFSRLLIDASRGRCQSIVPCALRQDV